MYRPAIDYIMLDVPPTGENINDVTRAAVMLSIEHRCDVRFRFKGEMHLVHYRRVMASVEVGGHLKTAEMS